MEHRHHSHHHHDAGTRNLSTAFWINTLFAVIELVGGFYTNSVAILSDALHDFGDSLSLGLAYVFQRKSLRARDDSYSYGYKRFSLVGAVVNAVILIVGSVFIIQESVARLANPVQPDARGMLAIAVLGLVANGIALLRLRRGKSLSERVVALHFVEDVLGWIAVLIGSVVMLFADVPVLDPILSIGIAVFILYNAYRNLRQSFRIILQGIPENVDVESVRQKILEVPGVTGMHDLHTWSMDGQYNIMTVHVTVREEDFPRSNTIKKEIRKRLSKMNIQHLTIETELEGDPCAFLDC
ncbi:MAG: cation diffusion facilitator family transporter [Cyclobacteriaceae bacterium]|jgi:cobalt-zinc-cadmium efflux system protein|nr:cation diffusion facilitator family transporter [Cyclobacteriaceae bacterium]